MLRKYLKSLIGTFWTEMKILFPKSCLPLVFLILMLPLTITYGDEEASLTVVNKTEHYLHIIIEGQPHLYVSPERGVTYATDPTPNFIVDVFYSPGQGVSGRINRTIEMPYSSARSGCDYDRSTGCYDCSTSPATAGSVLWEVTADSLLVE